MDALVKSDIFFFITGAAVVVLALAVLVALVYVIRILRNVSDISDRAREETELLQEDIHAARSKARQAGLIAAIFGIIRALFKRKKK